MADPTRFGRRRFIGGGIAAAGATLLPWRGIAAAAEPSAAAAGCARDSIINARVFLDGELVAGSLPVRFKPDDPPHTERFGLYAAPTLFEQSAPSTHTLSVDTAGYCGTEADPTGPPPRIRAVRIDVIETR